MTNPEKSTSFINYTTQKFEDHLIHFTDVNAICINRSGIIWLRLLGGGVNKINLNISKLYQNPLFEINQKKGNSTITSAWYDEKNAVIWLGIKNNGLFLLNLKNNTYKDVTEFVAGNNLLTDVFIHNIAYIERLDEVWVSVRGEGIFRVSRNKAGNPVQGKKLERDYINHKKISKIYEDKKANIWMLSDICLKIYLIISG